MNIGPPLLLVVFCAMLGAILGDIVEGLAIGFGVVLVGTLLELQDRA